MSDSFSAVSTSEPFQIVPAGAELGEDVLDAPALVLGSMGWGSNVLVVESESLEDLAATIEKWRAAVAEQIARAGGEPAHEPAKEPDVQSSSKVEVLVDRDPDNYTDVTVFVDGVDVTATADILTVDPGAGSTTSQWAENTAAQTSVETRSEAFRAEILAAYEQYASSRHLVED